MNKLTKPDYLILKYINSFDKVSMLQVEEHFKNKVADVDYCLSVLQQNNYINPVYHEVITDFAAYPKNKYFFSVTPSGKHALQDYSLTDKSKQHQNRKDLIFKVIPIIISFIALIKSFQPELAWLWRLLTR